MVTEKRIRSIFEKGDKKGLKIKLRDIAYVLLCDIIDSEEFAYTIIYGNNHEGYMNYQSGEIVKFIRDEIRYADTGANAAKAEKSRKMSFDENRNAMVELLQQTQEAMDNGEMEKKDGLKIMADIRVKLNDKFNVNDNAQENLVVVEPKCNFVCPHTRRECHIATKQELMEKYGLVEKSDDAF